MLRGAEKQLGGSLKCNKSGPLLSDCKAKNSLTQEEVASLIRTVSQSVLGPCIATWDLKLKMARLLLWPAVGKEFDSHPEEFSRD